MIKVTQMDRSSAWQVIKNFNMETFREKIKSQKLSRDREDLLFKFIKDEIQVRGNYKKYIEEYALSCLMPDHYNPIHHEEHSHSSDAPYEYDSKKNGQNIIKHGMSFSEVTSYTEKFGTLMVPIPSESDKERIVIFSDLDLRRENYKLELPPLGIKKMNYTISILVYRKEKDKFRFISSRLLSSKKKKYEATIAQALGEIALDEQARQDFIDHCVEYLEENLIQPISSSPQAGAL